MTSSLEGKGGGLDTPQKWWRYWVMTWWQGGGGGSGYPPKVMTSFMNSPLSFELNQQNFLNWKIFWIESWVNQYWIEYWMIHFLAKFKYWIESDWVSLTTNPDRFVKNGFQLKRPTWNGNNQSGRASEVLHINGNSAPHCVLKPLLLSTKCEKRDLINE